MIQRRGYLYARTQVLIWKNKNKNEMEKQTNERGRRETIDQAIAKRKQQQRKIGYAPSRQLLSDIFINKTQHFLRFCPHAKAAIATCRTQSLEQER